MSKTEFKSEDLKTRVEALESKNYFLPKGPVTVNANNLLTPNDNGIYRNVSSSISNCPEANGTLIVMNNGGGNSTVQMFVPSSGNKLYIRNQWAAGGTTWTNWIQH